MEKENSYLIKVEGMTCGNCALTITKYLTKKGLKDVAANAASGEVSFTTTENFDVEPILKGIDELGYPILKEVENGAEPHGKINGKTRIEKLLIVCVIFTTPLFLHMFVSHQHILNNPWLQFFLCIPVYTVGAYHFGRNAYRSLKNGIPNMDVLIILGASAAFIYSVVGLFYFPETAHNYLFFETAATIITFVLLGDLIEERTVNATTSSIRSLMQLQPSFSKIIMTDSIGKESIMEIESKYVKLNDIVLVNDGEVIPVDGVVIYGQAEVNESMLTGESLPVLKEKDHFVTGGSILNSGNIRVQATAVGKTTALSEIIRLVQKAQAAKPPMQKLADKISAVFVPVVLIIAVLTFLINYFFANLSPDIQFSESMMRSIAVLVIACPCAMGLATPAAVAVGLGRAARNGILIKGGDTLERFKDIQQIVFDKTGTLTTGDLEIQSFEVNGIKEDHFQSIVKSIENFSAHPIAKSILKQWGDFPDISLNNVQETKGMGLSATDDNGNHWELGSFKILKSQDEHKNQFDLHLQKNGQWVGGIKIKDELRSDAKETIAILHDLHYKTILISGDREQKANQIASEVGIDVVFSEQSPSQKLDHLERFMKKAPTVMVGDGINDAPAMAKADIGVSLSDATHVAMQSANVILSNNQLSTLPKAIRLGKMTYQTIKQNLFWAFFYNVLFIPFAAMGYLEPMWAALIMGLSDVVLVLNSLRLKIRRLS